MPLNLRYLLPEAEAQDMVFQGVPQPRESAIPLITDEAYIRKKALFSQLRKSELYSMLDKAHALGAPGIEPIDIAAQTFLAGHSFLPQTPPYLACDSHYAQDLFLMPQTPLASWEGHAVDIADSGKEVGYSVLATQVVKGTSVNFGKPTGLSDLALAPLARPQNTIPASPSPPAEANTSPREEQMQGAREVDSEALAREVYKIIKRRLLVEREQAQGMVQSMV
jgi:hypothetical protein